MKNGNLNKIESLKY